MPATPSHKMNGGVPLDSPVRNNNAARSIALHARVRWRVLRHYRRLLHALKSSVPWRELPRFILTITLVGLLYTSITNLKVPFEPFDDEADILCMEEVRRMELAEWENRTSADPSDITQNFNMTQVREARSQWDYVYRTYFKRLNPPKLTKYKTRLLRELYAMTKYVLTKKLTPDIHVSCNYLNDIPDPDSFSAFTCSKTSHACPDGAFASTNDFTPVEGKYPSWDDVVIVIMIAADRYDVLTTLADTWINRLAPATTLVISRDGDLPSLPQSLIQRPNVLVYDYPGPYGMTNLDVKAFLTWKFILTTYQESGKKFFLKIDDDTFLVPHNLMRFLMKLERSFATSYQPLYFGHPFCGHGDLAALGYATWCYAGGGAYGLNMEALKMMVRQISAGCVYFHQYVRSAPNLLPVDDAYGGRYEDVMVARCLRMAHNASRLNGTSLLACGSFFPYAPLHYYEKFGQDVAQMTNKLGDTIITLHNLRPSAMRYMDMFLFEHPIGDDRVAFSTKNPRLEGELLRICSLEGKKMHCEWSPDQEDSNAIF